MGESCTSYRARASRLLAMLFIGAVLFSGVASADASTIKYWTSVQPKGNVSANVPLTLRGSCGPDGYAFVPSSAKLFVDGVALPRSSFTASIFSTSVYFYYNPQPVLTDGSHTFRAEVSDAAGKLSFYQWSANVIQPPTATWISPTPGEVVYDGRPPIALSLADNTPTTSFTVAGEVRSGSSLGPVAATFGGAGLVAGSNSFALPDELPPGAYYLTATVTDAAGNSKTLGGTAARAFLAASAPAMTLLEECDSCHPTYRSSHPTPASTDCLLCHEGYGDDHMEGTEYCEDCHTDGWHAGGAGSSVAVTSSCVSCHSSARPAIARHTAASTTPAHESSCGGCHVSTLTDVHSTTSEGSSYEFQCDLCHGDGADAVVKAAVAAGDASCSACHGATAHTDVELTHTATSSGSLACAASGCHDTASTIALHADRPEGGCVVCHENPTSGDLTEGKTSKECEGCHLDRLEPHGYEPADHMADETCVGTCHTPAAGMTELGPLHDAAKGTPVACTACHAVLVRDFANLYPAGWDKTCTACHPVADLHPVAATSHTGTDVAYQDASFFGGGCSDNTAHTGQSACHDISNIASVHSRMPGNGCEACHGDGKVPSQECLTCHKPGYANTYTVPGTASANIVEMNYPGSDDSITAGWTWTTTPADQPIYSVVNTPYPPATTTRFVTITSTSAGGVLFGWNRGPAMPDNARITDVRIYAKAKATNTTYPRRMQGVFKIGGQPYLSSNQSNVLTAVWTAGTGTGFSTSSTRVDFTRQPLYGETIWRNPATGQDWTPAELNGTDPDSSLEAFGVNLTASTAANNVSLSQIYLKVTYYTVGESVTNPTVGTHIYHGDNVKYLHDPSDAPEGQRFATSAPHGWYDALYYQDCYDFCHRGNGGEPTFSANQGSWMWYSVGGDPTDPVAATRTLTLRPVTVPADSPILSFDTNYRLGTGAAGYVEISTDGGGAWTPLTGTVGGTSLSSLVGDATGWVAASYDLSAYAGQSAKLRFRYVNGSSTSAGWAFDSLAISGAGGTVFSDDAEALKPDWTNQYWTRSKGAFPYQ